jgi:hypothetical protein
MAQKTVVKAGHKVGRKPVVREDYNRMMERLKKIGVDPMPYRSYLMMGEDGRKVFKKVVEIVEQFKSSNIFRENLPDFFYIVGEWVTSLGDASGQRIVVRGRDLKIVKPKF